MKKNNSLNYILVCGTLTVLASQNTQAAEVLHIKEPVAAINKYGLENICKAGTLKSKVSRTDWRYRQKGSRKNHDEGLIAYVFCGQDQSFKKSGFAKEVQSRLGGGKLQKATKLVLHAVKMGGKNARALFCNLDRTKLAGASLEVANACDLVPAPQMVKKYSSIINELKAKLKTGIKLKPLQPTTGAGKIGVAAQAISVPPALAQKVDTVGTTLTSISIKIDNYAGLGDEPVAIEPVKDAYEETLEELKGMGLRFNEELGKLEMFDKATGKWGLAVPAN